MTDEELAVYVRTQDKESYRELVKRYEVKLMRYARYLLKDRQDAQDIVQASFLKAYINLNSFNKKKRFSSWIYRIVHNEAMNALNKRREVLIDEAVWESFADQNIKSPEDEFDNKALILRLKESVFQLPIGYREPILLFYYEDKTYGEISDIMKLPVSTVGTKVSRGRQILKRIYTKKERQ